MIVLVGVIGAQLLVAAAAQRQTLAMPELPERADSLWLSPSQLQALPAQGRAWEALVKHARRPLEAPNLADQDDPSNVRVLARALFAARTADPRALSEVREALRRVQGSEQGANALAVARELSSYVIAADLVGLEAQDRERFEDWLKRIAHTRFRGRTLRSTHEQRPNNWGTHAGASRVAVAAYLGDQQELARAAAVFRAWLGESQYWQGFRFKEPWWWPSGAVTPSGINPVGAVREGHSVDGVLPDDQRRGGPFQWPPPKENYVYEALQGAVTQALLLERQGYDPWRWGDRALLRAFRWLHEVADFPAQGDDTWLTHVINSRYCTDFPAPVPSQPGKAIGFTDWSHAESGRCPGTAVN